MQHPNLPDHARHDANLIAGHAAGDLSEADRPRAEGLLAACGACADLRRDLVAIAAATRSVPAPASLARDLRLSPEQADRLRRGSWLRAFLRPFGAAGSPFRPMAAAFTSLGVVGLVVGLTLSGNAGLVGGAGTGFSQDRDAQAPAASAAPAAEGNGVGSDTYAPMVQSSGEAVGLAATSGPRQEATDGKAANRASATAFAVDAAGGASQPIGNLEDDVLDPRDSAVAPQPTNPVIVGSLALLGIGLLLFGLRIASRRVR